MIDPSLVNRSASVEWASSIRPRKQVWLWANRIPVGTPCAWAGRGGVGKTTYISNLIARLSRGQLPGRYYGEPRPSLIWSGEDPWDKVLIPRLIAADADLSMVGRLSIASHLDGDTHEVTPRLPLDTDTISEQIVRTGAVAVFVDPIASTMSGDLHREADVRAALDALARVAEDTGAVMMFVRHFGKGGGNASDKMSGNHAFRDASRSVFLLAEDGDRVIVTQDKGNYAPRGEESFAFRLESVSVPTEDGDTDVARVVELGVSDVSVGDVINRTTDHDHDDHQDVDRWLSEQLANGPMKATEVFSAADAAGYSKDQAKRAKKRLGIEAVKNGKGWWDWRLAAKGADDQESTPNTPTAAPLLPSTSDGVQHTEISPREQGAGVRSLGRPTPATMPTKVLTTASPAPREHRRTIRGKAADSYPSCIVCGKPVVANQGDRHLSCSNQQERAS